MPQKCGGHRRRNHHRGHRFHRRHKGNRREVRRCLLYTSPGTIGDNLQIGRLFSGRIPQPESALREILREVELEKLPDDRCATLSGGEKQRLCLARVLLMDAETYLLDEPSSALDKKTEEFILEVLIKFVRERGKELIMVTHSPQVAGRFPEARVHIVKGRVEENTAHPEEEICPVRRVSHE